MGLAIAEKRDKPRRKSVVGQIVLVIVGSQLLFFGSFIALRVPVATGKNIEAFFHNQELAAASMLPPVWQQRAIERIPALTEPARPVRYDLYVPVIPLSIFAGYTLGATLGMMAAALYLLVGFTAPLTGIFPLAAGGGLDYFQQPGFGYLVGMVAAAWCAGRLTSRRRTSFRQALAVLGGLAAAHVIGLAYLLGCCLVSMSLGGTPRFPQWRPWVLEEARNLSWYPLPYDLLFSMLAVGIGFPFRWLVKTLTAPDIAARGQSQQRIEDLDPA